MAENEHRVSETTTAAGNTVNKTTVVKDQQAVTQHNNIVAERVIWYIGGVIMVLLAFRFILALLGANTTNGFANFIYSVSHPFVAPFFSLFSYNNLTYGVSRFEVYTLVAIAFYAVLTWGIAKLVTINQD